MGNNSDQLHHLPVLLANNDGITIYHVLSHPELERSVLGSKRTSGSSKRCNRSVVHSLSYYSLVCFP